MIKAEQLRCIGRYGKPHGVKGEIRLFSDIDFYNDDVEAGQADGSPSRICLVSEMDGIYVPFFFRSCRTNGKSSMLVSLEGMEGVEEVSALAGKEVYVDNKFKVDESITESQVRQVEGVDGIRGFKVIDVEAGYLGLIKDVDDTTINTLLIIEKDGSPEDVSSDNETMLVPAALIKVTRYESREVEVALPEGFLLI
ncbi:MAG: hypothetical protein LBS80_06475 [Tannerella sp.]|jgi:16S rRNA processing protein RimM|nr:hypothetical protein [Tannerella sp.]